MKRIRIGILVAVLLCVGTFSGAQDYRYFYSSALLNELDYGSSINKKKAMKELSMRRDQAALSGIIAQLDSPYLDVRLQSIKALSRYRDPNYLDLYEDIILDYENIYTVQERAAAIMGYVNINGYDPDVLREAHQLAAHPYEKEVLRRAINNERFFVPRKGRQ